MEPACPHCHNNDFLDCEEEGEEQGAMTPEEKTIRSECWSCKHKRPVPGDAHIRCANPDPNMKGVEHGIKHGWFYYPLVFDPVL